MISIKRYLDSTQADTASHVEPHMRGLLAAAFESFGSALLEMGACSLNACPGLGDGLKRNLIEIKSNLSPGMSPDALAAADAKVREQLQGWGHGAARHYQRKASEVKEMLLAMARTAESVGARDERCAGQMTQVTERLRAIASLEDLTDIRASIEKSAAELKLTIDRMTEEGKAVLVRLRKQVSDYQAKLEDAEAMASRDAVTGLSSRLYVEGQIEKRLALDKPFCAALVDIDRFKKVNDDYGHVVGDELLKQFGAELRSACRATDVIGRWGGDEFILLFDATQAEAEAQAKRLRKWVCGDYTVEGKAGAMKVRVDASIGLAAHAPGETLKELVDRADAAMYAQKAESKARGA